MNIYIICPVRNIDKVDNDIIEDYVYELEEKHGHEVHFPPRDVDQVDPTGNRICQEHRQAMLSCDEVHIFWDTNSKGSHFDFGMAYSLNKKIKLIKTYQDDTKDKSYLKVIKYEENRFV